MGALALTSPWEFFIIQMYPGATFINKNEVNNIFKYSGHFPTPHPWTCYSVFWEGPSLVAPMANMAVLRSQPSVTAATGFAVITSCNPPHNRFVVIIPVLPMSGN